MKHLYAIYLAISAVLALYYEYVTSSMITMKIPKIISILILHIIFLSLIYFLQIHLILIATFPYALLFCLYLLFLGILEFRKKNKKRGSLYLVAGLSSWVICTISILFQNSNLTPEQSNALVGGSILLSDISTSIASLLIWSIPVTVFLLLEEKQSEFEFDSNTSNKNFYKIAIIGNILLVLISPLLLVLSLVSVFPYFILIYLPFGLYILIKKRYDRRLLFLMLIGVIFLSIGLNSVFLSMDIDDGLAKAPTDLVGNFLFQFGIWAFIPYFLIPFETALLLRYRSQKRNISHKV